MNMVILDTNFIFVPGYFGVDIISEIESIVPNAQISILEGSFRELDLIQEKLKGKQKRAAKLGLDIIKRNHVTVISTDSKEDVDDQLVEIARPGVIIATQDKELKKRIQDKGAKVIILRQKRYLQMV